MIRLPSLILVAVTAVGAASLPPTTVSIPDTPAGRDAGAWLQAFDNGDRAAYETFLKSTYPSIAKDIDDEMQFRWMTGGFDLRKILTSEATKLVATVEDRNSEQFATLTLLTEDAAPYRIKDLQLRLIATPEEFAPPRVGQSELLSALDARAQAQAAAGFFSGAVLVAKNGRPVFQKAYGLADRARDVANTVDTRFRIGSMNKMFTATATLQLVQAGKIDLNAPLGTYLTGYPNKDVASKVTIAELLSHTGGTGDIFGPLFFAHRLQLKTLQDYENLYGTRALAFAPGSRWEYSNYGFILLGLVIEKVSGQNYYDYVRTHVYLPAGMTSTGSEPEDVAVPGRSIGYTWSPGGGLQPNTDTLPYRGTSAGGGYTTVGDLLRFAVALENHTLLDADHTKMLTEGRVKTPGGGLYGYGFEDETIAGLRCFGHNGGAPGMNGVLELCPADGYVVTVLANVDPPAADGLAKFIIIRLP